MKRKTSLIAFLLCIACLCACTVDSGMETPTVSMLDGCLSESEDFPTTALITNDTATEEITTSVEIPETSTFEIHFLDVGQADAALVLCDDEAMLIDGGNAAIQVSSLPGMRRSTLSRIFLTAERI